MKTVFVIIFSLSCFKFVITKNLPFGIDFEDCGGKLELVSISISTCHYIPCKIERRNLAEITIEYDPRNSPYQANTLEFDARWIIDGLQTKALFIPETCNNDGCIRNSPNGLLQFTVLVYVSDTLPIGLMGYLYWRTVYPNNGDLLFCSRIPVFIY
ncbi:hypothetical protein PVAND_002458 [Polypedilum vanderplanki]|uniref:MD-2-related lipid-recognition domain-containing protein n=1 Tax=Polypedilum vanderplanki TaxID=319348 RepID=A0A9J6BR25_POLVA|nr:hypothetical protein PVAND_002458 [Polypedilum vanderplanki]